LLTLVATCGKIAIDGNKKSEATVNDRPRRPGPAKQFPIRLEGVQISQAEQDVINADIQLRGGDLGKPSRLRNGIIRDYILFRKDHAALFLAWIATRSTPAIDR
jgi:hypothetical protein